MLFIGRKIDHKIGLRDKLFIGAYGKIVFCSTFVRLTLLLDGFLPQGIRNIKTAVAHIQSLVEALGATTYNYNILSFKDGHTITEFFSIHKSAGSQLGKLFT